MSCEPLMVSTWSFGARGNEAAWPALAAGGSSLDAVEASCCAVEADPDVDSVGFGGLPDATGRMSLDGAIMLSPAKCGSVAAIRRHLHTVSIARKVMECTPHMMLAGEGADEFADAQGFEQAELLSDNAREKWERWKQKPHVVDQSRDRDYPPHGPPHGAPRVAPRTARQSEQIQPPPVHPRPYDTGEGGQLFREDDERRWAGHDTIGVLALDQKGVLAGACSTSGYAYKLPGRVGDSPVIGHGLYVDPYVGAVVATGAGEIIMGVCASFLTAELIRAGKDPLDAAVETIQRIIDSYELNDEHQAVVLVLTSDGRFTSAALKSGYRTSVRSAERCEVIGPDAVLIPDEKAWTAHDVD
ncbi:MAG: N(4)-(beta-N-acetylglucosaminyl)-L-asparaginase [Phycisphaerales bacterium]|nr:MAG: N(4)-(beta-N-acetylglucosaminyl)-L-asparaginase [Phycisphaerales bacterium]